MYLKINYLSEPELKSMVNFKLHSLKHSLYSHLPGMVTIIELNIFFRVIYFITIINNNNNNNNNNNLIIIILIIIIKFIHNEMIKQ